MEVSAKCFHVIGHGDDCVDLAAESDPGLKMPLLNVGGRSVPEGTTASR